MDRAVRTSVVLRSLAPLLAAVLGACSGEAPTSPPGPAKDDARLGTARPALGGGAFAPGDVFISLKSGDVQWWHGDGTIVATLDGMPGHAEGMRFDGAGVLYVAHWCGDGSCTTGNTIERFGPTGISLGAFGTGYDCNPTSLDFDTAGNVWVGQADCWGDVLQLTPAGAPVATFDVAVENRGSGWLDLMPDDCTIVYTSQGPNVLQYSACGMVQLPEFNTAPLPDSPASALRLLPDGGLLVADASTVIRLDALGNVVRSYDVPGEPDLWTGLDVVPGGSSFWVTNLGSPMVYQIDLATGAVLMSFDTGTGPFSIKGVTVLPPGPVVTTMPRMTGGGSVFTNGGMRVTHGFELHCDAAKLPNNLEVNWHAKNGEGGRFHLETLTAAVCTDDPTIDPKPPAAPFDTYEGKGTGRVNGVPGGSAHWIFTDAGEPGKKDRIVALHVWDETGTMVLGIDPPGKLLTFGNHQAHK